MEEKQEYVRENSENNKNVRLFPSKLFNEGESEFDQGIDSIASRTYMRGLVLGICDSFKRPLVVLQKSSSEDPVACDACGKNDNTSFCAGKRYSRLESTLFYEHWAVLCKKIRKINGKNYCCEQDAAVADYLLEKKETLNDNQRLENFIADKEICGYVKKEMKEDVENPHTCIRYHCPRSQYDELALNINVNGIEGVLILGQFLFKDMCNDNKPSDDFTEVVEEYFKEDTLGKESFTKTQKEDFDETVNKAFQCVKELEKALKAEYDLKIDDNVRIIQENMVVAFRDYFHQKTLGLSNEYLDEVDECIQKYELLKKALRESLRTFIYAAGEEACGSVSYCLPTGLHFKSGYELYQNGEFIGEQKQETLDSVNLLFQENDWFEEDAYSIFCRKKLDLHEEKYIYVIFENLTCDKEKIKKLFDSFLQFACLEITQLYARYNGNQMTLYTKVMRHEMGQLNEAILIRMNTFEEAVGHQAESDYTNDFINSCKHAIEDFRSHAHATMLRANSSRYFTILPPVQKEWFYPYDSFLYKWKYIYEKAAKNKLLDFVMDPTYLSDLSRPMMYADKSMIEQVAYNLTNNALKYSIAGTTISIDCKLSKTKDCYQLIVTNYGWPITEYEKEKIFKYNYRGGNHNQESGSGLGLYLSGKIAEHHQGMLTLDTEKVSDFDVSCLLLYEEMPEKYIDMAVKEKIDSEIHRLKEGGYMHEISKPQFKNHSFTPFRVNEYLNKGTMKYIFVLSIPYKK